MTIPNGFFLTLEGPECGGKSTQSARLAAVLRREGHAVLETREPGGTRIGEELRNLLKHVIGDDAPCPEAEVLMFSASRVQLMQKVIRPHLELGGVVICDRFADSTTVYQGYARGLDLEMIHSMHAVAVGDRWPDLTLVLDVDPEVSAGRGAQRQAAAPEADDRFEKEARAFHENVRAGFLDLARKHPERFRVVNAMNTVDVVHQEILEIVANALA